MSISAIVQSRIHIPMDALTELCRRYQVRELSLFGSVLRDDFRDDSDVDILVEFEPEARIGFFELARLQRELASILGREIDIVPKLGLNPVIRRSVLESSEVIYAAR